ncbi:MAG: EB domain-containing protein, partial [Myxococcota bacterium]
MRELSILKGLALSLFISIVGCYCGDEVNSIGGDVVGEDVVIRRCTNSAQCNKGEVCSNGYCVKADGGISCRNRGDCPGNMECVNGVCREIVDATVDTLSDVDGILDGETTYGKIRIEPETVDFGGAHYGVEVKREVTIENVGKGVLVINEIKFSPDTNPDPDNPRFRYNIVSNRGVPFEIESGSYEVVEVIYRQDDSEPDRGYLQVISSDSEYPSKDVYLYSHYKDEPEFKIVDRGVNPPEVLYPKGGERQEYVVNVGDVDINEEVVRMVTIMNSSEEGILVIKEAEKVDLGRNGFEVRYVDVVDGGKEYQPPIYLSSGGMVDMEIRYKPDKVEYKEESRITIKTNDSDINDDGA